MCGLGDEGWLTFRCIQRQRSISDGRVPVCPALISRQAQVMLALTSCERLVGYQRFRSTQSLGSVTRHGSAVLYKASRGHSFLV